MTKTAYKLFRRLKSGEITSLYCNKTRKLSYNVWMEAENHRVNGLAERVGWHCTEKPVAPHLKMVLKSGEVRVWKKVLIDNYTEIKRPTNQGCLWYLAKRIKILDDEVVKGITIKEIQKIGEFYIPYIPLFITDIND